MKIKSYGLIDSNGNIIRSSNNFTVKKNGNGSFLLKFRKKVHNKTVVATARNLDFCDSNGTTMEVCNYQENKKTLGFSYDDPSGYLGFSFILIR